MGGFRMGKNWGKIGEELKRIYQKDILPLYNKLVIKISRYCTVSETTSVTLLEATKNPRISCLLDFRTKATILNVRSK
ncbi:hypothetical protein WH008_15940 [Enterobacter hormaechei]|uniref:hypothetical protein n=1 Tax=Enterobacter hormaechei TaxID=158836 RepID=UPI0025885D24|nr:hypothetical protein [uncultured Enterobacter sp.]